MPALLPVNASIRAKKVGSLRLTVKDSHFDSSMLPLNADGRPKSACFLASVSHSAQEPPTYFEPSTGAEVIEPRRGRSAVERAIPRPWGLERLPQTGKDRSEKA